MAENIVNVAPRRRFRMPRTIAALMLREMSTTNGRSPGGYLWAVLEPVLALALLSVVFSYMFRTPALGVNFPLFYATGYLPFMYYSELNAKIATSIRFSRPLLAYPTVTFVDALIGRFLVASMTHMLVAYIILTGILTLFDTRTILSFPPIFLGFAMAAALGLGLGTLNCYLFSAFPAWERAWGVLTRPLFIISCILFTFEAVPESAQQILWFNPLVHVTGTVRSGVYATYDAAYTSPLYVFGISALALALGLALLRGSHRAFVNE